MRKITSTSPAMLVTTALLLVAGRAGAQGVAPEVLSAARALHDEAITALDARDYAAACPRLERVVRMVPEGLGARMTLAECYEGAGRLASAWTAYVAVEEGAAKQGQAQRALAARKRAAALRPKLAQLTVAVPDAVRALPGLQIRLGDAPIDAAVWGLPVPVDRGEHAITAIATGKRPWKAQVKVEADGAAVVVEIGALEEDEEPPPAAPARRRGPVAPAPSPAQPPAPRDDGAGGLGAQRTLGLIVGGAGVVALGVGGYFGVRAITKQSESNANGHCDAANLCDDVGFELREDGYAAGNISTGLFIAGGVALAGGATLLLTAPPRAPLPAAQVGVGPSGLTLRGRW